MSEPIDRAKSHLRISARRRHTLATILVAAIYLTGHSASNAVEIAWSTVPKSLEGADQEDGDNIRIGNQHLGFVPYKYSIGTYDVTASQYAEFLNNKDFGGLNSLGLYDPDMAAGVNPIITFDSSRGGGQFYGVIPGRESYPVTNVSWVSAVRFANWLNNGQGNGSTETGAYTLLGGTAIPSNLDTVARNGTAKVFLPSEDEWYKAAFHIPGTTSYYQYGTSSNVPPTVSDPTNLPNHVNGSPTYDYSKGATPVGAYSGTVSPYGLYDMAGNVEQWLETLSPQVTIEGPITRTSYFRTARGGASSELVSDMRKGVVWRNLPHETLEYWGFRVATVLDVPEPSSLVLAAFGLASLALYGLRKRSRA